MSKTAVLALIDEIVALAGRAEHCAAFGPKYWRGMNTLRTCIDDDGRLVRDLAEPEPEWIRTLLIPHPRQELVPPGVGELSYRLYQALKRDSRT